LERAVTIELVWLKNWRLELIGRIAELEADGVPEAEPPNGPSVRMALAWTREELDEVEARIARLGTRAA
jgi:BMFP domain-containing protein YqiC